METNMESQTRKNLVPADLSARHVAENFIHFNNLFVPHLEVLMQQCHQVTTELEPLDKAARHDELLDDETWQRIAHKRYDFGIAAQLGRALNRLRHARSLAEGRFFGDIKGKTEGRLDSGISQIEALLAVFEELETELTPRAVYLVRQDALTRLLWSVGEFIGYTRASLDVEKKRDLDPEFLLLLRDVVSPLYRVKAVWTKMRDNPSQKMSQKLQGTSEQLSQMHTASVDLKTELLARCRAADVGFGGRGGPTSLGILRIGAEPYEMYPHELAEYKPLKYPEW
jgi:hypothetical protein